MPPLPIVYMLAIPTRSPNVLSPKSVLMKNTPRTRRVAWKSHEETLVDGNGIRGIIGIGCNE